ncbi:hypothetical protein HZS_3071 [Henneguya salminicola]|nr:hypothetical protein HZS_3071 [Henneguya salminicola]
MTSHPFENTTNHMQSIYIDQENLFNGYFVNKNVEQIQTIDIGTHSFQSDLFNQKAFSRCLFDQTQNYDQTIASFSGQNSQVGNGLSLYGSPIMENSLPLNIMTVPVMYQAIPTYQSLIYPSTPMSFVNDQSNLILNQNNRIENQNQSNLRNDSN